MNYLNLKRKDINSLISIRSDLYKLINYIEKLKKNESKDLDNKIKFLNDKKEIFEYVCSQIRHYSEVDDLSLMIAMQFNPVKVLNSIVYIINKSHSKYQYELSLKKDQENDKKKPKNKEPKILKSSNKPINRYAIINSKTKTDILNQSSNNINKLPKIVPKKSISIEQNTYKELESDSKSSSISSDSSSDSFDPKEITKGQNLTAAQLNIVLMSENVEKKFMTDMLNEVRLHIQRQEMMKDTQPDIDSIINRIKGVNDTTILKKSNENISNRSYLNMNSRFNKFQKKIGQSLIFDCKQLQKSKKDFKKLKKFDLLNMKTAESLDETGQNKKMNHHDQNIERSLKHYLNQIDDLVDKLSMAQYLKVKNSQIYELIWIEYHRMQMQQCQMRDKVLKIVSTSKQYNDLKEIAQKNPNKKRKRKSQLRQESLKIKDDLNNVASFGQLFMQSSNLEIDDNQFNILYQQTIDNNRQQIDIFIENIKESVKSIQKSQKVQVPKNQFDLKIEFKYLKEDFLRNLYQDILIDNNIDEGYNMHKHLSIDRLELVDESQCNKVIIIITNSHPYTVVFSYHQFVEFIGKFPHFEIYDQSNQFSTRQDLNYLAFNGKYTKFVFAFEFEFRFYVEMQQKIQETLEYLLNKMDSYCWKYDIILDNYYRIRTVKLDYDFNNFNFLRFSRNDDYIILQEQSNKFKLSYQSSYTQDINQLNTLVRKELGVYSIEVQNKTIQNQQQKDHARIYESNFWEMPIELTKTWDIIKNKEELASSKLKQALYKVYKNVKIFQKVILFQERKPDLHLVIMLKDLDDQLIDYLNPDCEHHCIADMHDQMFALKPLYQKYDEDIVLFNGKDRIKSKLKIKCDRATIQMDNGIQFTNYGKYLVVFRYSNLDKKPKSMYDTLQVQNLNDFQTKTEYFLNPFKEILIDFLERKSLRANFGCNEYLLIYPFTEVNGRNNDLLIVNTIDMRYKKQFIDQSDSQQVDKRQSLFPQMEQNQNTEFKVLLKEEYQSQIQGVEVGCQHYSVNIRIEIQGKVEYKLKIYRLQ